MFFALYLLAASAAPLAPERAVPAGGDGAPVLTGAATPLLPALCERQAAERLRCAGVAGIDVFLHGPDARRTVSLGDPRPVYPALPFDAALGSTLRWRMGARAPVAAILAYRLPAGAGRLDLVLRTARADGTPACVAAVLAGEAGRDAEARADASAGFRCGVDAVRLEGTPPPALAGVLRGWARRAGSPP